MSFALQDLWHHLQRRLFPLRLDELGELGEKDHQFVKVVSRLPLGRLLDRYDWTGIGRPPPERTWILHAFLAKSVYGLPTPEALVEMLKVHTTLRRLCGWAGAGERPHPAPFSRAFTQFAADERPQRIHEKMIRTHCGDKRVGQVSRASTAIEARARPAPKSKAEPTGVQPSRKRGRPTKGEVRPPTPPGKLAAQVDRSLAEHLAALPRQGDIGCKTNSQGPTDWWIGFKLHLDPRDGDSPVRPLLTSASRHDVLGAIPLAQRTAQRVRSLDDLRDAAYEAVPVHEFCRRLGHVPIIDQNAQRQHERPLDPAQQQRFHERTSSARVNGRLKDEFGGQTVRVRGAGQVMAHLMDGVIVIAALGIWARLC